MPNYKRYYLQGYNYVFITIITNNRLPILLDNVDLLRNAFAFVLKKYKFKIFAISVLKNHLHLILLLEHVNEYSIIISNLKKYFSHNYNNKPDKESLSNSMQKRKEAGIWQRRFYEHIIRNEEDLNKHLDYVHYNSYKHYKIAPKDWKYSTFLKFVKNGYYNVNWCDFDCDMELE